MRQWKRATALLLMLVLLLSGCGAPAEPAGPDPVPGEEENEETATPSPESASAPAPTPTPDPKEEKENQKRQERLERQQDGFIWERGYLYAVDDNGNLKKDCYIGVLYFGRNGRYTSGLEELDKMIAEVIEKNTDTDMTRMEKLRAMYDYTVNNLKYVGFGNHDFSYSPAHGPDGWMPEAAVYAMTYNYGNCYHFAALFAALARGLGYQAYAVGGEIGAADQQHGWVDIVDEEGDIWLCDPETEFSRFYWQGTGPDLFWRKEEDIGTEIGLTYREGYDPFQAERELAEARETDTSDPEP